MRILLLGLACLAVAACSTNTKNDDKYAQFNGTFACPALKSGPPETGVDFQEMTFTQEIKEVNGVPIMVTQTVAGDVRPSNEKPSFNAVDGQWHIKDFLARKGVTKTKKVFVEFQGENKIRWISEMPSYTTDKGIKRKAMRAEGVEWVDENGDMNYTATNYQGPVKCRRVQ